MVQATFSSSGAYSLLVHGGAGESEGTTLDGQIEGCAAAADAAKAILEAGGSALDAVQRAVEILEDDARFNSATGGALTSLGTLELDAAIMDGGALRAGAVCSLPPFRHPIAIARAVLEARKHVLYAGHGAEQFARAAGFEPADPASMISDAARASLARALERATDDWAGGTVGAVARDRAGHVAAATSTGGIMGKSPGRVGDSPILGAGTYADDRSGAASATGQGEGILRVALCARVLEALRAATTPADAAHDALLEMKARVGARGGLIVVAADGRIGLARTTKSMPYAASWEGHRTLTGA